MPRSTSHHRRHTSLLHRPYRSLTPWPQVSPPAAGPATPPSAIDHHPLTCQDVITDILREITGTDDVTARTAAVLDGPEEAPRTRAALVLIALECLRRAQAGDRATLPGPGGQTTQRDVIAFWHERVATARADLAHAVRTVLPHDDDAIAAPLDTAA